METGRFQIVATVFNIAHLKDLKILIDTGSDSSIVSQPVPEEFGESQVIKNKILINSAFNDNSNIRSNSSFPTQLAFPFS
ncbi:hypothetical protein A3Q56_06553 [Intoshia linei]|uniref:Peptidase A2 domain-containing protein n=1 Tax=Intoshia linei TaxID=1819745 RepID=A0A177AUP8_9BILA|nr:hypothetical protein A3Q56_06553 [Intoshia linei]